MIPQTRTLETKLAHGWLTIALNRPETRNALSSLMIEDLMAVLENTAGNSNVRGITMRGNGGTFCAGGDLKGFKETFDSDTPDIAAIEASSRRAGELFERINTMPQVVVMLVEGAAMAGGLGMVCAGDIVAVTKDANFALTEVTLGIPPAQIAPFVIGRLGLKTGRRLMLTAARFDGAEAHDIGLADYLVDEADSLGSVEAIVKKSVLRCAPGAIAATKEILLRAPHHGAAEMRDHAAQRFAECLTGDEAREGISAFLEKRRPEWSAG